MEPQALAHEVIAKLRNAGHQAYLVGGCVRDMLLGVKPKDFDVATDALPEEVRKLFRNCRLVGRRFRLAHVFFGREIIEVATFRAATAPSPGEEPLAEADAAAAGEESLAEVDAAVGEDVLLQADGSADDESNGDEVDDEGVDDETDEFDADDVAPRGQARVGYERGQPS